MAENSRTSSDETDCTTFVTARYYVIGCGETISDLEASGEWLVTDDPVDIRR